MDRAQPMPSPCHFRRSVELDATIEKVFAFHADPHNVEQISPGWQRVEIEQADVPVHPGAEFRMVIRFFGIVPMRWQGVWREVQAPGLLVDEALESPFASWRHRHEFQALADGRTRMTDHVEYRFPGGWLGKWFGETLGRFQFRLMFADRHARTRRWMHEHS